MHKDLEVDVWRTIETKGTDVGFLLCNTNHLSLSHSVTVMPRHWVSGQLTTRFEVGV